MLFEKSDAFTIDFTSGSDKDYCFPLPVGKAKMGKDYNVEIETRKGDAVKAMFAGVVRLSRNNPPFGNVIVVRHGNGLETVYGNNAENLVKSGDRVKAGQTIAIVGTSKGRTDGEWQSCQSRNLLQSGESPPAQTGGLVSENGYVEGGCQCDKGSAAGRRYSPPMVVLSVAWSQGHQSLWRTRR